MPLFEITTPSGRRFQITAPEGATEDEVLAFAQKYAPKGAKESAKEKVDNDAISKGAREFAGKDSDALGGLSQHALNLLTGSVDAAGQIGATLAYPIDKAQDLYYGDRGKNLSSLVTGKELPSRNEERRARLDENVKDAGAQTDSWMYKTGKVGTEILGTAGVGGVLAKPLKAASDLALRSGAGAIPALDTAATALASGGMKTGAEMGRVADIATRVGAGATVGGASAGLVNPEDAAMGAAIGGAFPVGVKAAGAVMTGAANGIRNVVGEVSKDVAKLAERARELGIEIPADRLVNSRPLNAVAAGLNYVPFSGRAATEDAMNSQLNRALSRTFGQDTSNVTLALRKAEADLGGKFEQTLSKNGVAFDQQLLDDIAAVYNKAETELGTEALKPITANINEIIRKGESGMIDGQAAYNIKRDLDRIGKHNDPTAWHALELKQRLMDALNRSLGEQGAAEFAQVRQQYGTMLDLQKLAKNGAEGEVSIARVANMKDINNPQLQELADIAAQFVKPREGQHGAAQRAGVGALAAYVGGVPGLAAGAALGRGANAALNSEAARNAILRAPAEAGPETVNALTQGAQRALPIAGAAAGATGATAAIAEPQKRPTVAGIGEARSVDEAIAAASAAVRAAPSMAPIQTAPAAPVAPPQRPTIYKAPPEPERKTASGELMEQPFAIWTGRRGSGYVTVEDAQMALPTRQKMQPDLTWRIEQMDNGVYRLAGYQPKEAKPEGGSMMNASGTAIIPDPDGSVRKQFMQRGIQSLPMSGGRILVNTKQAREALQMLGQ